MPEHGFTKLLGFPHYTGPTSLGLTAVATLPLLTAFLLHNLWTLNQRPDRPLLGPSAWEPPARAAASATAFPPPGPSSVACTRVTSLTDESEHWAAMHSESLAFSNGPWHHSSKTHTRNAVFCLLWPTYSPDSVHTPWIRSCSEVRDLLIWAQ